MFKRRPKKDLWNQSHVIYSVPCEVPPDKYIGQTKRKSKVRIREHECSCEGDLSGIQPNMTNDNGIPIHCASTGHKFLFEQTTILAKEPNNFRRRVIEGVHIYNKRYSCVNLIAGLEIDKSWSPILKELVATSLNLPSPVRRIVAYMLGILVCSCIHVGFFSSNWVDKGFLPKRIHLD